MIATHLFISVISALVIFFGTLVAIKSVLRTSSEKEAGVIVIVAIVLAILGGFSGWELATFFFGGA